MRRSEEGYWRADPMWAGEVAVVVGGGPSVRGLDLRPARNARVIAVNNAYKIVPWADALFYYDPRWMRWHADDVRGFAGMKVTAGYVTTPPRGVEIKTLRRSRELPLSDDPGEVCGVDSGYMAVTLAYRFGARRIVLAGFDMRFAEDGESHWHPDHPVPSSESNYRLRFLPTYPALHRALADRGVELVRCTPSALECVPETDLAEAVRG